MGRILGLVAATVMLAAGGLWTLQSWGVVPGGFTAESGAFAIFGPLLAGLGVALAIVVLQRRH